MSGVKVQGKAPVRIFVEGLDNISNKVLLLEKRVFIYDLRKIICKKMALDPGAFWIYLTQDGVEQLANEGDLIRLDGAISITVKMVAGSSYYNADTIKVEKPTAIPAAMSKEITNSKKRLSLNSLRSLSFRNHTKGSF